MIVLLSLALTTAAADGTPLRAAATVNGSPITVHDIKLELSRARIDRQTDSPDLPYLQAQTLRQLVARELVLQWLSGRDQSASQAEIDLAITRLTKQLDQRETSLADYLASRHMSHDDLQRALRWQLSWERFLQRYITDDNLEKFFQQRRVHFDGTQLRVAHILLAVPRDADEPTRRQQLAQKQERARQLRAQIEAGELSFDEAARRHSDAPTATAGGEIGVISRHEPMPEVFTAAAYGLALHGVSEPVTSPFGVHLVQCLEILPGQRSWQDVRDQLEPAMVRYLFDWVAQKKRPQAKIEYTGNSPYFEPGTDVVVAPNRRTAGDR